MILGRDIGWVGVVDVQRHSVTLTWPLTLALPECFLLTYFRHIFLYPKDISNSGTDYHMYLYQIVLSLLTDLLHLINFAAT